MTIRRTFTETIKKKIAASQRWVCSACDELLESTYQVDHTVPLWAGGEDSLDNATAMCVSCHARKTQNEALERNNRECLEREKKRKLFEQNVRQEEEDKRVEKVENDGSATCKDCMIRYYPIFPHACREVKKRCSDRLEGCSIQVKGGIGRRVKKRAVNAVNIDQALFKGSELPFGEFFFTKSVCRI